MELYTHEKAVLFLPVNMLTVWSLAFLATQHTTMCLDIFISLIPQLHRVLLIALALRPVVLVLQVYISAKSLTAVV